MASRGVLRLGSAAARPLAVITAVPIAAGEFAGSVWAASRAGVGALAAVVESVPRLAEQAERILDAVEPPVLQVASALDVDSLDKLVLSLRALPELVPLVLGAVAAFDVFVAKAEAARYAASLTVQHADDAVRDARRLIAQAAESVDRAGVVVARSEPLVGDVGVLTQRVSSVVDAAEVVAGLARQIAGTVSELVDMAAPVVELSLELSRQAEEPARTLLQTAESVAPKVATITPQVIAALTELSDRLPDLLRRIDTEVLPTVQALQRTPNDVRALRDSVEEIEPKLGEVEAELAGLPGAKALRRRGRRPDQ